MLTNVGGIQLGLFRLASGHRTGNIIPSFMNNDGTLISKGGGIVECRICGFNYLPELEEDRDRHEREHLKILSGGLPYEIREFLKRTGWEIIKNGDMRETPKTLETAKRAVAFAYWARAISNSIPENELQPYMAAHFAWLDAIAARDEEEIQRTSEATTRWNKYG